jgi:uncharacterized protein (DUF885 family)
MKPPLQSLANRQKRDSTDDGAWKLPDGDAYYASRLADYTTTDMTAEEIHNLGLAEVARIHDEMRGIMKQVGFEGSLKEFFDFTRTDPQFFKPNTPEGKAAYLDEATSWIDQMREDLPNVFNTFPKADLIVKAVEPFREKSPARPSTPALLPMAAGRAPITRTSIACRTCRPIRCRHWPSMKAFPATTCRSPSRRN